MTLTYDATDKCDPTSKKGDGEKGEGAPVPTEEK